MIEPEKLNAEMKIVAAAVGDAVEKLPVSVLALTWGIASVAGGMAAGQIHGAANEEEKAALTEVYVRIFDQASEFLKKVDCGCGKTDE